MHRLSAPLRPLCPPLASCYSCARTVLLLCSCCAWLVGMSCVVARLLAVLVGLLHGLCAVSVRSASAQANLKNHAQGCYKVQAADAVARWGARVQVCVLVVSALCAVTGYVCPA